jgi:tetratricopeptide (TPR) repeat protein
VKVLYPSLIAVFFTNLAAILLPPDILRAAALCDPWVAKMVSVQGTVEVRRAGQTQWQLARLNDTYCAGDRIQVGGRSRADVALANQPLLRLDQDSTITLGGVKEERTSWIELLKGAIYFFSRLPRNLEIITAFVNAGVEGTEGLVKVDSDKTFISIFEGRVLAVNQAGSLSLTGGQAAVAEQGKAPVLTVVVRPRDAVQWALYYLPTLYFRAEEFPAGPGVQGAIRDSIDAYAKGDLQAAFDSIKGVPDNVNDPRFFAYRASLLLAVGRADEAAQDIARALSLKPMDGDALALQAIIAIVQNEKEKALDVARKAVEVAPKSASALIALSYAQQANFDLEGALSSLKQATQVDPENALAWARLAELWMSFAELDEALEAAKKAIALSPNLSRTQTVLGFAYLLQVNTKEAKVAFEKAIEFDQADYLPRLGLGLAKIREGDLPDGRSEIEIATSLDPNNSIVRSYLGKAYYEEKRIPSDQREYAIAKELDPNDPTPWFYDAIAKQTTNRPVEALQDMQQAIELNNNRAVYRSSLLLDSDLAARSAALGQIYNDLGFQQLGLVEGWKSVNTDPTNFSAHRLLADTYAALPRHEIARVSELLQSQLLQPINITPIQPRLAESNLFLINTEGPATLSFNEFNPLFNRNGLAFQTTGLAGQNSTYGGEGVLSGIYNKASFSFGGFHFQTDGWRTNADQKDSIGNAFLQFELSPKTSIQTEYRHRDIKLGDVALRFAPDDFRPNFSEQAVINSGRFGFRHAFSPSSIFIGNYMYQTQDRRQRDSSPTIRLFDLKGDDRAHSGEMQYLFRSRYINVVSGVGYFNINSKDSGLQEFVLPPLLPFLPPRVIAQPLALDNDARHTNVYLYSYLQPLQNVTFTLGGSGDFFDTDVPNVESRKQFNPKFGFTWNPLPDTTLRAAAFRTLKRILITNQTLEPTQVAGFNQFFDDFNATRAWLYGAAVDQKFTKSIYGGIEYTFRDLKVPVGSVVRGVSLGDASWDEQFLRYYLFWTPHEWVALSTGYDWEKFDRDELFNDGIRRVKTHRVPLGVNVFHPSGLSAALKATYINQQGVFRRTNATVFESGKDDFWTVDAGINYRLPKRYGFITVGVTNLFDQKFKYFDTDRGSVNRNPRVIPDRVFFGRITLAIP